MQKYCNSEITSIFDKIPIVENLARKKFVVLFVLAMIKTRAVQFCEIAQALNDKVKAISNEVRIQDFFREVPLNYEQVALLLAAFLPRRGKVTLCIDRTEWDFGKCQVNILMIVVRCKEITLPLYWELLENNSGNSHTDDRIDLLKKCIELFIEVLKMQNQALQHPIEVFRAAGSSLHTVEGDRQSVVWTVWLQPIVSNHHGQVWL